MVVLETRKCSQCGEIFMDTSGGFILKPTSLPRCPHCGSIFTKKILKKEKL